MLSEIAGPSRRGRPILRWKDRIKEYMHEGGANRGRGLERVRRGCMERERWRLFCLGHHL